MVYTLPESCSVNVYYENNNGTFRIGKKDTRTGKKQIITAFAKYDGPIYDKPKSIAIKFYFDFGAPFILAYFNCQMARDAAFNLISNTALYDKGKTYRLTLSQDKFFMVPYTDLEAMRKLAGRYVKKEDYFKKYVDKITKQGFNFIHVHNGNRYNSFKLSKIQLEELLDSKLPPEISKNDFAKYLAMWLDIPKELKEKKINHFFFWRSFIELKYDSKLE